MRRKRGSRRTARQDKVVINGPEPKKRPVRKTIHFTEEHAYKLSVLGAMSSLNGRELSQSGVIEDALNAWFASHPLPRVFEVELTDS